MDIEWMDIVRIRLDKKEHYCLWYESEEIGFISAKEGLLEFEGESRAREYTRSQLNYRGELEVLDYDIDSMERRLNSQVEYLGLEDLLDFWNLAMDLATSLDMEFKGRLGKKELNNIYDKLFIAGRIDLISESGPVPEADLDFTDQELLIMEEIIRDGLRLLRSIFK